MKIKAKQLIHLFLILPLYWSQAVATDLELEKHWSDELGKIYGELEAISLNAAGNNFLALYSEDTTSTLQGGAILLHSLGTHPDWPEVISPLRNSLPKYGWSTLSIQIPILNNKAMIADYSPLFEDSPRRIQAAISFFQEKGIQNIAIIGHGLGAAMAASFLANTEKPGIQAFIGISMIAYPDLAPNLYSPALLENITLPILDIYGSRDYNNVTTTAKARANAARKAGATAAQQQTLTPFRQSATAQAAFSRKAGFIAYRQLKLAGADHSFVGFESLLEKRIVGWLKHHAGGITLTSSPKQAIEQ